MRTWSDVGFMGNADHNSWSTDVKDKFLTNLTLYWVTQTITSSVRIYYDELGHSPLYTGTRTPLPLPDKHLGTGQKYCAVPTGFIAANDLFRFPKAFAQLTHNVQHWTSPGAGGHFFALEQPVAMAKDLALFFHEVLDFGECIRAAPEPGALPALYAMSPWAWTSASMDGSGGRWRWRERASPALTSYMLAGSSGIESGMKWPETSDATPIIARRPFLSSAERLRASCSGESLAVKPSGSQSSGILPGVPPAM